MQLANTSIELVDIDSIKPHPQNPREGDVGEVVESIKEHGFYGTIVCQVSTRLILAGNHRWKAAKFVGGIDQVPVAWVDCDDDEALRILLVDNRTSDLATYDLAKLADLLQSMSSTRRGLMGTGYDGDALDQLLQDVRPDFKPNDDPPPGLDKLKPTVCPECGHEWVPER